MGDESTSTNFDDVYITITGLRVTAGARARPSAATRGAGGGAGGCGARAAAGALARARAAAGARAQASTATQRRGRGRGARARRRRRGRRRGPSAATRGGGRRRARSSAGAQAARARGAAWRRRGLIGGRRGSSLVDDLRLGALVAEQCRLKARAAAARRGRMAGVLAWPCLARRTRPLPRLSIATVRQITTLGMFASDLRLGRWRGGDADRLLRADIRTWPKGSPAW